MGHPYPYNSDMRMSYAMAGKRPNADGYPPAFVVADFNRKTGDLVGVVGPFWTAQEAHDFEFRRDGIRQFQLTHTTQIMRVTSPYDEIRKGCER